MDISNRIAGLYKTEASKMISVLCKYYGIQFLDNAEEIVNDTFLTASEDWVKKGIPNNPIPWLYSVAKNKANNRYKRDKIHHQKVIDHYLQETVSSEMDFDIVMEEVIDSQLMMMFVLSHPSIPMESQIGLALRILCGFTIDEIAKTFLTNKETISKRLYRAKEVLRENGISLEYPTSDEFQNRLQSVLRTLYLIFNKGYSMEGLETEIRKSLCLESIHLCSLLVKTKISIHSDVYALLSLFCFQYSRFDARLGEEGEMILYEDQKREFWNLEFIQKGKYFYHLMSQNPMFSKFHLEANIAFWHSFPEGTNGKWQSICELYSALLFIESSSLIQLNRIYAVYRAYGNKEAIEELGKLALPKSSYYFSLLGELYSELDPLQSKEYFMEAISYVTSSQEMNSIQNRMKKLL
ncbi:RNA polymerase sigma factor [Leptospira levettii]|uniref:RNA polymerase sigma factor n=1 Tax=Leptospira levettii TaxID=2023178 RepID=UPI0010841A4E|nr:DUF6596 domain-containing protein [Leptospira levettii]TGM28784.1 RNA polymerase subunit sigma [Leptospira levettii]TGM83518.1 RNA polymerase subunit sigma [Leptospira levettii]